TVSLLAGRSLRPCAGSTLQRPPSPKKLERARKGVWMPMSSPETYNQKLIENQEKILANQEQILANQETLSEVLKKQAEILANQEKLDEILTNQESILANQEEILSK